MKKTLVMMSMLAALCAACTDDDDVKKSTDWSAPNCSPEQRGCEGDLLAICVDGRWTTQKCSVGKCENGHCVSKSCNSVTDLPVEASVADKVANGIGADVPAIKSCEDGYWIVSVCDRNQSVAVDSATNAARCVNSTLACANGAKRCSIDGLPQSCNAKGEWVDGKACEDGKICSAGDCVANPECIDGSVSCDAQDAKKIRTCVDGRWNVTQCGEGLECSNFDKQCIDKSGFPVEGETCDEDFVDFCEHGEYFYCADKKINHFACDSGMECVTLADSTRACLYTNDDLGGACKFDGQALADMYTISTACEYAMYGIMRYLECVEIDGKLYADGALGGSVCDGKNTKISCASDGKSLVSTPCDGDCEAIPGDPDAETDLEYFGYAQCSEIVQNVGDACNVNEFSAYCKDSKTAISCPGGTVYAKTCQDGNVCQNGICVPSSTCWGVGCSGNGGSGQGGNNNDDTLYDCSDETYEGYTLSQICVMQGRGEVALCVPCDEEALFCATSSVAASLIGQSANENGADVCGGGGGGGGQGGEDDWEICDADCSSMPGSKAICYGGTSSYQCVKPCTTKGAESTLCDVGYLGDDVWTTYPAICEEVAGGLYYVNNAESRAEYITCNNACNADNTACDASGGQGGEPVEACDFLACDDLPVEGGIAAHEACVSENEDSALCFVNPDDSTKLSMVCMTHEVAKDSSCGEGEKAYSYEKNDGTRGEICAVVGNDVECLLTDSGEDDTFYDCSNESYQGSTVAKVICTDSSKPVAMCVPCNEAAVWCVSSSIASEAIGQSAASLDIDAECGEIGGHEDEVAINSCNLDLSAGINVFGSCKRNQKECEAHYCWYDEEYQGYYVDYVVCDQYEGNLTWLTATGTYKECNGGCNDELTDCDSEGGTLKKYQ